MVIREEGFMVLMYQPLKPLDPLTLKPLNPQTLKPLNVITTKTYQKYLNTI